MQNLQECTCTGVLFQPATCNFIEKRCRHVCFSVKIWENFFGTTLLWKNFCELVLTGEFHKKWWTDILIYKKESYSQRTDIVRESVYFTDISFLKCFTKKSFYLLLLSGKNLTVLGYISQWLCLHILSSK